MPTAATSDLVVDDGSLESLVDEVIDLLGGLEVPAFTTLTGSITDSATSFTLGDASAMSRGVIEIDHELMLVGSTDQATGQVTVVARGYRGTAKSPHAAGSVVSISPPLPRATVIREINNELREIYPQIVAVSTISATLSGGWVTLPAGTSYVLDVLTSDGVRVRSWQAQQGLPLSVCSTGRGIQVPGWADGQSFQVIVGSAPTAFTSTGQTWASTGLASSTKTLVLLGAATRILPAFDSYRLTLEKVQDQGNPTAGSASMLNRELRARYRERLQSERDAFYSLYPLRIHFTQ